MEIKKILMAALLVGGLASCGQQPTEQPTDAGADLAGTYDLTLWVSETAGVAESFQAQIAEFETANPGIDINAQVVGVTEAESATQMLTDVEAGADIYCFAQDQFARLVQGNALSKLGKGAADNVRANNDAGAVGAVTSGDELYAYPLTSDNGYFMYYDKRVVQESSIDSLSAIIADCNAAGKKFSFEVETSAWYIASWFFAVGCNSTWTTDSEGAFTGVNDDFNSELGLIAAKGMKQLVDAECYLSSSKASDFAAAIPSAVVVSGTWDYNTAKEALGDNLGVADLPSFEVDGKSYHLGSYSGNKLMGVKPTVDAKRSAVLHKLAQHLTSESSQKARCEQFGWGPSNTAVQAMDIVKNNPALSALAQQNAYAKPQGQIHGSWWDLAKVIGTDVKEAKDEAGLKAALAKYEENLNAIFSAPLVWGLVGSMEVSGWSTNVDLTEADGKWTLTYTLAANDEFKFRINTDWDTALGASATEVAAGLEANFDLTGDNIKCLVGGEYKFTVDPEAAKVYIAQ